MLKGNIDALLTRILRAYQVFWIMAAFKNPFIAHLGARQIGKDWTWSFFVVLTCILYPGHEWQIVSKSKIHAQQFIRDCRKHLQFLNLILREAGEKPIEPVHSDSQSVLHLSNDSRIESHSSNPDAVQGKRGSFLLNEIGALRSAQEIFETGYPIVTGQLDNGNKAWFIIIGNATRRGTFWHKFFTSKQQNNGFTRIRSTWRKCFQSLGYSEEWLSLRENARRINLGVNGYAQWFECRWRSSNDALIPYDAIYNNIWQYEDGNIIPFNLNLPQSIGYDVGITTNPTVFAKILLEGEMKWALPTQALFGKKFREQFDELDIILNERDCLNITVDARGLGAKVAEDLEDLYPGLVIPFMGTLERNYDIFSNVKDALESELLKLPPDDELLLELENIETTTTDSGRTKIILPEDVNEDGQKCHGDRAYALALALAGVSDLVDTSITPVKPIKEKEALMSYSDIIQPGHYGYMHKGW